MASTQPPYVAPLATAQYKLAINATYSGGVDAIFQAVVRGNEGDPTMIAWRTHAAPPGGSFESLVTAWLTLATASGGMGLASGDAAARVAALRLLAAAQTA